MAPGRVLRPPGAAVMLPPLRPPSTPVPPVPAGTPTPCVGRGCAYIPPAGPSTGGLRPTRGSLQGRQVPGVQFRSRVRVRLKRPGGPGTVLQEGREAHRHSSGDPHRSRTRRSRSPARPCPHATTSICSSSLCCTTPRPRTRLRETVTGPRAGHASEAEG